MKRKRAVRYDVAGLTFAVSMAAGIGVAEASVPTQLGAIGDGNTHPIGTRFGTTLAALAAWRDPRGGTPFAWTEDARYGLRFTLVTSEPQRAQGRVLVFRVVPDGVPPQPAIAAFDGNPAAGQFRIRAGMEVTGACIRDATQVAAVSIARGEVSLSQMSGSACKQGSAITFSLAPHDVQSIETDWLAFQTAIAARAQTGGAVRLPSGRFQMGDETLVVPPLSDPGQQSGQVEIVGDGIAATSLIWSRDLGAGACAMGDMVRVSSEPPSFSAYRDFRLIGPGRPNQHGDDVAAMDGLCIGHAAHVERVEALRFHAGLDVLEDHQTISDSLFGLDTYGIYLAPYGGSYGNLSLRNVGMIGNARAGLGVSWGNMLDASDLRNIDLTVEPVGFLKESVPAGVDKGIVPSFVSNSLLEAVRGENLGSGLFVDEGRNTIDNNSFIDVEPSMANGFRLGAQGIGAGPAPAHAVTAGASFTRNVFIHSDFGDKGNEDAVTGALIASPVVVANDFGTAPIGATGARPYVASGTVAENRIATFGATGALFRAASDVAAGTAVVLQNSGGQDAGGQDAGVRPRRAGETAFGIALQDGRAGGIVPVATRGEAPARPDQVSSGAGIVVGPALEPGRVLLELGAH